MHRIGWWMACATLTVALLLSMTRAPVYAFYRVNCDTVMKEFRNGKQPRQIASDLNLHENSVHRCIRAAARAQRRSQPTAAPTAKR
jgi:uncharacterized protein (DUF433 family)